MPIRKFPKHIAWRGPQSIPEIARRLSQGKAVTVSLPWSFHHALCVRLNDYAKLHGMLDVTGGVELVAELAGVTGLHDLAQLREPARLTGARIRVYGPPPQLQLFFPVARGDRRSHVDARRVSPRTSRQIACAPTIPAGRKEPAIIGA